MKQITIRSMNKADIDFFPSAFSEQGWDKPRELFVSYYKRQQKREIQVFVAETDGIPAGYVPVSYTHLDVYKRQGIDRLPKGEATDRLTEGCIALEGGAFRGVYGEGVLDALMEADLNFRCTIGVSAGALNGATYVSGQIGRSCLLYTSRCV